MDPEATLKAATSAARSGDWQELEELLDAYAGWRSRGGFQPKSGDRRAKALARKLSEADRDDEDDGFEEYVNPKFAAKKPKLSEAEQIKLAERALRGKP